MRALSLCCVCVTFFLTSSCGTKNITITPDQADECVYALGACERDVVYRQDLLLQIILYAECSSEFGKCLAKANDDIDCQLECSLTRYEGFCEGACLERKQRANNSEHCFLLRVRAP